MTRITEGITIERLLQRINDNRVAVDKYSEEISTGLKVLDPGDTSFSGTISNLNSVLERVEGATKTAKSVGGLLQFQDDVLDQASEILVRAKELATQGASETLGQSQRDALATEVFELREHLIGLTNSKYQGSYIFHGTASDRPAYSPNVAYTNPATPTQPGISTRYSYGNVPGIPGADQTNTVKIGENLSITLNTPGNQIFDNAVYALERLGRALGGYETLPAPPAAPDGTGTQYSVANGNAANQIPDIRATIDLLDTARETDIQTERINVVGRLKRVESAQSLFELSTNSTKEVLSDLQEADIIESATKLQSTQTALEASMAVNARLLNLSILNFL